jgi:hypothetical protein
MHGLKSPQLKRNRSPQEDGKCAFCGGVFYRWREWQSYCSVRCRNRNFYANRKAELQELRALKAEKAA